MQFSLPETIDQLFESLIEPDGLHHITREQLRQYRVCARQIGMEPAIIESDGRTSFIDPAKATHLRLQLKEAKRALEKLTGSSPGTFFQLHAFAGGTMMLIGNPPQANELDKFLRGTHMMAIKKTASGRTDALQTTLSTRGEALAAIELIRPDISHVMRYKAEEKQLDMNQPGELLTTPMQIHELAASYRMVIDRLAVSAEKAQETMRTIREESQPKLQVLQTIHEGGIVTKKASHGRHGVMISTRPRAESTEHFMLDLDIMQPVLDLSKHINEMRRHPDGESAKYRSTQGELWVRCADQSEAQHRQKMLQTLLQLPEDDKRLSVTQDYSKHPHHPDIWLKIPNDLLDDIQKESQDMHDSRDLVRMAFESGDHGRESANAYKKHAMEKINARVYLGEHAREVLQGREQQEPGAVHSK